MRETLEVSRNSVEDYGGLPLFFFYPVAAFCQNLKPISSFNRSIGSELNARLRLNHVAEVIFKHISRLHPEPARVGSIFSFLPLVLFGSP